MSPAAYQGIGITIKGIPEVQELLDRVGDPRKANRVLQKAANAGGEVMARALVAEAPYRDLKRSVWARPAKRRRPAAIVGHHKRNGGFIWHMVVGGTRDHGPRRAPWLAFWSHGKHIVTKRVRGVRSNPFVARAYSRSQAAAMRALTSVIDKYLESL
jgi:hypothetical protein